MGPTRRQLPVRNRPRDHRIFDNTSRATQCLPAHRFPHIGLRKSS